MLFRLPLRAFLFVAAATALLAGACGGKTTGTGSSSSSGSEAGSGGGNDCKPLPGCNSATDCPAGDGCNRCSCDDGVWACGELSGSGADAGV